MKSLSSKIKMKKRKTFKKSNDMSKRSYLQFLKKRKSKTPVDNIVEKNVELMEKNISPQNIHDVDKPLKQSTVNRVKLLEQPKIDIKMPKSVQSEKDKNIKSVFVEEDLKQPKFVFDRTDKSSDKKDKSSKNKSYDKKSKPFDKSKQKKKKSKPKKTKRKSRKVSFTVKKPKKSECDRFKKQTDEIDKKDDIEVDTILKGKGIKTTGKNGKLKRDLLKHVIDDKMNISRE
tara:strand:- start:200 stop:889 length:690 start_codon:yes stop_codon:yes gene_type:complete